jgi:hypothetical protein
VKGAGPAREAAQLLALRRLRQQRAEAAHGAAIRRTGEASDTADAAGAAHREAEAAWSAAMVDPRLAFTMAAAWGAVLGDSHAGAQEAARVFEEAAEAGKCRATEAARATAESDVAKDLAHRLARRRRRAVEERDLARFEDSAGARRRGG